ncbi:MAG: nodulation protein NfeD [Bacteroidetes bacterium]|nr:nodulation protein NfeD [Bacteroidota bacterium]MCW5896095.1 nodulation protein NfeD [Bacteroidota bacterium]
MPTLSPSRLSFLLLFSSSTLLAGPLVHVITVDASINPATADFIRQEIRQAHEANASCIVLRLNTPGGLLKSTRVIVSDILDAPLPVIVFVWPPGAQSASAGTFITLSAHIAAMAPGTNIGAAHPVGLQGGEKDSIMNEKATNDAAAFIRTISEKRNRNIEWAEEAVRKSISITETEALSNRVIDVVAPTVNALLDSIDGKTVEVKESKRILMTKDAEITQIEMGWRYKLLDLLSDPNVAYIFFLLGIYGLMFELYNPGSILPGVVGVIAMIIALYSLHTMPLNYAGLALIIFAIILFIAEIKVTSYGLLTVAGVISLTLGSIMLIEPGSTLEFIKISWSVIIPAVLFTAAFFAFAIGMGIRAQRRKPTTGIEGIVGEQGEAISSLNPDGQVRVHGEIWSATSTEGKIPRGASITVVEVENLHLRVKPTFPTHS